MCLINFELFIYTIKLCHAMNSLVEQGELPPAMQMGAKGSLPDLYVDFTRDRSGPSDEMARDCVERDLEELRMSLESLLFLRTMDRYVELQPKHQSGLEHLTTPEYLQRLVQLRLDPGVEARAEAEIESVKFETNAACQGAAEEEEVTAFFAEHARRSSVSSLDKALELIVAAQEKKAVRSYVSWFWSVGGLRQQSGVLAGNVRGRRSWRYMMSDELLAVLVQLALLDDPAGRLETVAPRGRLRFSEFLAFLHERFGILVDSPPKSFDSPTFRAGAGQNVEALKRRLRQMGFFEALSDDFNAQYLRHN